MKKFKSLLVKFLMIALVFGVFLISPETASAAKTQSEKEAYQRLENYIKNNGYESSSGVYYVEQTVIEESDNIMGYCFYSRPDDIVLIMNQAAIVSGEIWTNQVMVYLYENKENVNISISCKSESGLINCNSTINTNPDNIYEDGTTLYFKHSCQNTTCVPNETLNIILEMAMITYSIGLTYELDMEPADLGFSNYGEVSKTYADIKWSISDGVLVLSGNGDMRDYDLGDAPWYNWRTSDDVKKIVVNSGITSLGNHAFYGFSNVTSISLPNTIKSIGEFAFYCCDKITTLNLPGSLKTIKGNAFFGIDSLTDVHIPCNVSVIEDYAFSNMLYHDLKVHVVSGTTAEKAVNNSKCYDDNIIIVKTTHASNAVSVAKKTATITSDGCTAGTKCKSCGKVLSGCNKIYKIPTIELSESKYVTVNGVKKPAVVVKNSNGKEISNSYYTVTYSNDTRKPKAYKVVIKFKGNYSGTVTRTFPTYTKGLNFTKRTANYVTLKWTKNESADGYEIWQYKPTGWAKVKTITDFNTTSAMISGLSPSVNYKFKIRGYKWDNGKKSFSPGFTVKSVKTLPSYVKGFTYSSRGTNYLTLKWVKNTSADGYVIEQYKGGKWVTVRTVTDEKIVSRKITGLARNTSYKFRIKAYKYSGSTKLYSDTVVKSFKTL